MAKVPAFAKAFAGRWRIVEMDVWDNDFLDLVEEAHLTFTGAADGEIAFGALKGFLDVRYGARDGAACAEFSWEGHDENDPACGRGWVTIGTAGRLVGHFYIHNGDDSEPDSKLYEPLQCLAMRLVRTRMWAMKIHACALAMDFSQSLASRRHRPSQAKVRSTTQRRGSSSKPLAMSERLTICSFQSPILASAPRSLGPA